MNPEIVSLDAILKICSERVFKLSSSVFELTTILIYVIFFIFIDASKHSNVFLIRSV